MMPAISVHDFTAIVHGRQVETIDWPVREALQGAQQTVEGHLGYPLAEFEAEPLPMAIRTSIVRLAHLRLVPMEKRAVEAMHRQVERDLEPFRAELGPAQL